MTQNIYDTPEFFEGYSRLARSVHGLDGAPEWPALRALVADVRGRDVVDLGCGFGWFCRWADEQGAASILGLDVSANMLARARATTISATIRYEHSDLERLQLPAQSVDLAYSSLTLHYLERLPALVATVHRALRPGGRFVFSCEHPIYTAPARPGFIEDSEGQRIWPLNQYALRGERRTDWLAEGVIKQHRTVADYVNLLIGAGFTLTHLDEWAPDAAQLAAQPALAQERDRPMMLLVAANR
ncbi:class I SAM-dependent methyltransferase [Achromobacter ruhlandii]|jgi:SAM-dependent methyltransferase|uniref:Class I SAM-dependent methyltransferase n=1 Tax=Achromobacter ruhlandii TaxID=72557 RepID=A0A848NFX5_9BURK|nr:class I SAM-dependent methyltransferase [Achromobacter ruhlandii]AKP92650.1 Methyltransferase type 11 [Achromobacter xylosoxidans]AOU96493.1 SAM-dependent methyltransferase [Achromobacter ruhlandii]MCI1836830.1 class I SAM-dependent methyltransferase [Achromobacter ruhlandii]MCZ8395013.1 class I SAM-dependent methyltransferase [Achromobacter ruhlandii]MCZ8432084.1 class I SAM-dependent methyltransferase [Achromobacter ruhlandii]